MPHIILEHNLSDKKLVSDICKNLHEELSKQETVKPETVKSRSVLVSDVGIGTDAILLPFMHVEVKLFPGRDPSLKNQMSQAMLKILKAKAPTNAVLCAELT